MEHRQACRTENECGNLNHLRMNILVELVKGHITKDDALGRLDEINERQVDIVEESKEE